MSSLNAALSRRTSFFGLKLWVVIGICIGTFLVLILFCLSWAMARRRSRRTLDKIPLSQIPNVSKEIKVDRVGENYLSHNVLDHDSVLRVQNKSLDKDSEKMFVHNLVKQTIPANAAQFISMTKAVALIQGTKEVLGL